MVITIGGQHVNISDVSAKFLAKELSSMVLEQPANNPVIERDLANVELAIRRVL